MSDVSRKSSNPSWSSQAASGTKAVQADVNAIKDKVGDAYERGKSTLADTAAAASDNISDDLAKLRKDMFEMQETLAKFASKAGNEAMKTAQNMGAAVTSQVGNAAQQVGEAASEYASAATQQVKTVASEVESMARKNPLGTIGAALLVGVVVGMMTRGGGRS